MNIFQAIGAALKTIVVFFGTVEKFALALDEVADVTHKAAQQFGNEQKLKNASDLKRIALALQALESTPADLTVK